MVSIMIVVVVVIMPLEINSINYELMEVITFVTGFHAKSNNHIRNNYKMLVLWCGPLQIFLSVSDMDYVRWLLIFLFC